MSVAFRSLAQGDSFNTTLTVNKPAGAVDDDALLALIMDDGTNPAVTAPAGWTLLDGPIISGTSADLWAYSKRAASEGASWNWTSGGAGQNWTGVVAAYSGASKITLINQHANLVAAASATPTGASVTPNVDNCMIVGMLVARVSGFPATPGGSWNERSEITSTNLATLQGYLEDLLQGAQGAVAPSPTFNAAPGSGWATVTVAIAPDVASDPPAQLAQQIPFMSPGRI